MKNIYKLTFIICCLMIFSCAASRQQTLDYRAIKTYDLDLGGKPPEQIKAAIPEYPDEARRMGIEGSVWVKALIDSLGKVADVEVVEDEGVNVKDFVYSAIGAAFQTKWKPALSKDGNPVTVWVTYKIDYKLR